MESECCSHCQQQYQPHDDCRYASPTHPCCGRCQQEIRCPDCQQAYCPVDAALLTQEHWHCQQCSVVTAEPSEL